MSGAGAVAAPHHAAAASARSVLDAGGSAVDAAIAAAAVLTVVYPHNVALGGDLIAVVRHPDGRVVSVNASGGAPARQTADLMRARHGAGMPLRGVDTVTVPGGVAGWGMLHRMAGRLPWARLFDDPVRAADEGVAVAPDLAANLASAAELFDDPGAAAVFAPGGRRLGAGDRLAQPALAETLRRIARHGADEFYRGETAERLVGGLAGLGSLLERDDLALFEPELRDAISGDIGGVSVHTSAPNTQGFVLLRALAAFARLGLSTSLLGDDASVFADTFRDANRMRDTRLADPRFARVDLDELIGGSAPAPGASLPRRPRPRGDTVGVAALDGDGLAVSLIQSVYYAFGASVLEPQTGVLMHNRGSSFSLDPDSPNVLAPRKRPAHTLMPVIVTEGDRLRWVLATQGGQGQPQVHAQLLLQLLGGSTPQQAVGAPRFIVGAGEPEVSIETVVVEGDVDPAVRRVLAASGPSLEVGPRSDLVGQANVVAVGAPPVAASDPRADGAAPAEVSPPSR